MNIPANHSPTAYKLSCNEHSMFYSEICLFPGCYSRLMCRICKMNHPDSHLGTTLPLSELSEDSSFIDNIIDKKELALNDRINGKTSLLRKINSMFHELQNEIEKVLIETKTRVIHTIEDYYLDLSQHCSHTYFQDIKDYLKKLWAGLKQHQDFQPSAAIDNISASYFRTMSSIDHLVEITSKFENESLNCQEILDLMKSSCDKLSRSFHESSKEQIKAFSSKEQVRVAPQTITCVEHCSNAKLFVTGGNYGLLTFWDESTFSHTSHLQIHEDSVVALAYFPDLQTLVTSSKDKTLGILILNEDGSVSTSPRMETQKVITQLAKVEGQNKLATISEKGNKIRIWELSSQRLENIDSIEIPPTLKTSKIFGLGQEGLLGITYEKEIKIVSINDKKTEYTLNMGGTLISSCYVAGSNTIHAIISIEERDFLRHQEVIWKKAREGGYEIHSRTDIENHYGLPVDIVSNSHLLFTVYEKGFSVKKAKREEASKLVEVLSQACDTKNQKPVFLSKSQPKIVIPSEMKKLKIYDFS